MRLPDSSYVFLVDECAGAPVANGIRDAGGQAELLTDRLGVGVRDEVWIPQVVQLGCHAFVSRDIAQRTNPNERKLLETCGVHVFYLRGKDMNFAALHAQARDNWRTMVRFVATHATPFVAHVTSTGVNVQINSGRRSALKRSPA